jgi:hypothetical protein
MQTDPLGLLVQFSFAGCEDPSDLTHALNALTNMQVTVSYIISLETMCTDYAKLHIKLGILAIMNCIGAFQLTNSYMPSWVPDWRQCSGYMPLVAQLEIQKQDYPKVRQIAAPEIC